MKEQAIHLVELGVHQSTVVSCDESGKVACGRRGPADCGVASSMA